MPTSELMDQQPQPSAVVLFVARRSFVVAVVVVAAADETTTVVWMCRRQRSRFGFKFFIVASLR